jgi:hypothetical protein
LTSQQSRSAAGCNGFEAVIEIDEEIPKAKSEPFADCFSDSPLQRRITLPLPQGVSQGYHQFLQRAWHSRPLRMGNATSRECWLDTLGEQQRFTSVLMFVTAGVQFLRVQNLAGIVEHHRHSHEVCIKGNAEALQLCQEQFSGLADEVNMGDQALRGTDVQEEIAGPIY